MTTLARNAGAQVGARLALSVGRLGLAMAVVRWWGTEAFGRYVLLLGLVAVAEWLADFGQGDMAVRAAGAGDGHAFATLDRLKRRWAPAAAATLPLAALLLGYAADVVAGALTAAIGVYAYARLQPLRARCRAAMYSERDVAAEVAGFALGLALTLAAASSGGGPTALMGAYAASRLVHWFVLARLVAPDAHGPRGDIAARARGGDVAALARAGAPLGVAGLMVALYEGMAPIMLAQLLTFDDVARYGAAARLAFPVLVAVQAAASAFFPALARQVAAGDAAAATATQDALLWCALILAGGFAAGLHGGAEAAVALLGELPAGTGTVLRWLAALVLVRAVTAVVSPLVVLGGRQRTGLALTGTALVAQAGLIALLAPRFGVIGVVAGYLAVEALLGIVPVWRLARRATGAPGNADVPLRLAGASLVAGFAIDGTPLAGSWAGGVAAGTGFLLLAALSGALTPSRWRAVAGVLRA